MAQLFAPGVYVKEVSSLPKVAVALPSSMPVFLGHTQNDPTVPVKISNMEDYERLLGGPGIITQLNLEGQSSQNFAYFLPKNFFYFSLSLYFANGGGPCWVASVGKDVVALDPQRITNALNALEMIEEISLVLFPELPSVLAGWQVEVPDNTKRQTIVRAIIAHCAKCGDRFALFDVFMRPRSAGLFQMPVNDTEAFREQVGTQNLSHAAAYYPQIEYALPIPDHAIELVPRSPNESVLANKTLAKALELASQPTEDGAKIAGLLLPALSKIRKTIATYLRPYIGGSPAVAAIIGNVDAQRGVWKAPANVAIVGASSAIKIWWGYQNDTLADTMPGKSINGKDINELKAKAEGGVIVWGARTLAGADLDYRYIPVKRLMMMVAKSLKAATQFAVFEPNTADTWLKISTMCENFLHDLWRDGALMGGKPEEAYKVSVGLGKSMTADDMLNGIMRVQISLAPVRPAEFIELQFMHTVQKG
jgi:uncharacterized protein